MNLLAEGRYVQYGAGACAPEAWINFDCSPTLRLARIPFLGRLIDSPFPPNMLYGDIVRGLPIPNRCAKAVYASHVLMQLTRTDCLTALRNTFRLLIPGGRFRMIVPDLKARAAAYLADSDDPGAAHKFMQNVQLGVEKSPRGIVAHVRHIFGNHSLWMWDEASMAEALRITGFTGIRRCQIGDSGDAMFALVEDPGRFHDGNWRIQECAMEALRPI
jgi:hypothetical protein